MFVRAEKTVSLDGLTGNEFLALASLSMNDLSWDHCWNGNAVYARPHISLFAWGERMKIEIRNEEAHIACRQPVWKFLRPERYLQDIDDVLEYISHNRQIYSPQQLAEEQQRLTVGHTLTATERIVTAPDMPPVTLALIAINIIFFLVFSFSTRSFFDPNIMDIFDWGGNIRLHTLGGQGWRVITSCFLHFGIMHVFTNMVALFFIGRLLEPVLGKTVFLTCYISTGALSSLLSILVAGTRLSAGASGAIFGMYGVFLALLTTHMLGGQIKKVLFQGIFLFIAYELLNGMGEQVDNAAHIGGVLSGFVFGYIIFVGYHTRKQRYLPAAGIAVLTAVTILSCLHYFHNDTIRYERMLKRVGQLEDQAMAPFNEIRKKSSSQQLDELTKQSEPAWQIFIRTMDSAQGFRFGNNKVYPAQKGLLLRYAQLRQKETDIWIQSIRSGGTLSPARDSIRKLIYEKYDSLQVLRY